MREKISTIVLSVIQEFSEIYEKQIPLKLKEDISLFGTNGVLDSLGLVSLIVMIEDTIENEIEVSLILADEKAMSQKTSPFLTAKTLINFICKLIDEEKEVWISQ